MNLFDPAWLIHVGTALLLIGYFIRDELKLRVMIIVSSAVFNLYYWLVPSPPLWDAVMTGFLMIGVNLWVLSQVLLDRTTFRLSEDEKRLLVAFSTFTPGQFRRLLKAAKWREAGAQNSVVLTLQSEPCHALYYIFEGQADVEKGSHRFTLESGAFLGEIAFIQKGVASATTRARPGARYVEWDAEELRSLEQRFPELANALNARLASEMAKKLGSSIQSETPSALRLT